MGVKVGTTWKFTWKHACFCAVNFKIYTKAQKHARFHVFSPFSAYFYSPLHHYGNNSKGLWMAGVCVYLPTLISSAWFGIISTSRHSALSFPEAWLLMM